MVLSLVNKFSYIPNLELNYYILEKAHRKACRVYRRECREHPKPKTREPADIRHPGMPVQRIRLSFHTWRDNLQCPTFTSRLYNQVASLGRETTLKVQVSGSPDPEVHWFKDSIPINFNSTHWIKEIRKNVHILIIKNATMKDQGVYLCRASNDAGSVSTSAFVFVQPPSVRFVPFPSIIYE